MHDQTHLCFMVCGKLARPQWWHFIFCAHTGSHTFPHTFPSLLVARVSRGGLSWLYIQPYFSRGVAQVDSLYAGILVMQVRTRRSHTFPHNIPLSMRASLDGASRISHHLPSTLTQANHFHKYTLSCEDPLWTALSIVHGIDQFVKTRNDYKVLVWFLKICSI